MSQELIDNVKALESQIKVLELEKIKVEEEVTNLNNNKQSLKKLIETLEPKAKKLEEEIKQLVTQKDKLINDTNLYINKELDIFNKKKEEIIEYCKKSKDDTDTNIKNINKEAQDILEKANKEKIESNNIKIENTKLLNELKLEKQQNDLRLKDINIAIKNEQQLKNDNLILLDEIKNKELSIKEWLKQLSLLQTELKASQISLDDINISLNEKEVYLDKINKEFYENKLFFENKIKELENNLKKREERLEKREKELEEKEEKYNISYKNLLDKEKSLIWFEEELKLYNAKNKRIERDLKLKQLK